MMVNPGMDGYTVLKPQINGNISVRYGDAGDVVASPTLKNWPLFGQKF